MEGEGKKTKCFIKELSRGITSWIRFGVEGMNNLLTGVEECRKVFAPTRRPFVWRENGRSFRLECKENNARKFLLCSATNVEGKKHRMFFSGMKGFFEWLGFVGRENKRVGP